MGVGAGTVPCFQLVDVEVEGRERLAEGSGDLCGGTAGGKAGHNGPLDALTTLITITLVPPALTPPAQVAEDRAGRHVHRLRDRRDGLPHRHERLSLCLATEDRRSRILWHPFAPS